MIYTVANTFDIRYETLCMLERLAVSSGEAAGFYSDYNANCDYYLSEFALAGTDAAFLETVRDAYRHVEAHHGISPADLKKYFTPVPESGFSIAGLLLYMENALSGTEASEEERITAMLSVLELFTDDEKASGVRTKSLSALTETLASAELPAETKWACIDFCINFTKYRERALFLLDGAAALLNEQAVSLIPMAEGCAQRLNAMQESGRFTALLREKGLTIDAVRCDVIPCVTRFSVISLYSTELEDVDCVTMHYGVLVDNLQQAAENQRSAGDEILRFVKALNDKNRLQILIKLKETPLFGHDIVSLTGLTAATVSHHMSELAGAGLVTIEKQGARILYGINRKQTQRLVTLLKSFT